MSAGPGTPVTLSTLISDRGQPTAAPEKWWHSAVCLKGIDGTYKYKMYVHIFKKKHCNTFFSFTDFPRLVQNLSFYRMVLFVFLQIQLHVICEIGEKTKHLQEKREKHVILK